jgi:hypothetical protein
LLNGQSERTAKQTNPDQSNLFPIGCGHEHTLRENDCGGKFESSCADRSNGREQGLESSSVRNPATDLLLIADIIDSGYSLDPSGLQRQAVPTPWSTSELRT